MSERPPSHLRAAIRLLAEGVRRRADPGGAAGQAPRRRRAVERAAIPIDPRRVARFRAVTGGGGGGDPEMIPPLYSSTWETALALELFADGTLPLPTRGLVHLESELVVVRPLRAGDRVRCRVEVEGTDPHRRGLRVRLRTRNWNAAGQLCQENALVLLLPGVDAGGQGVAPTRGPAPPTLAEVWSPVAEWALPANLGRRYARASGDYNPIHLWGWSSRLLGYDRPVLHGFCALAMVAGALADRRWGDDPGSLRRLHAVFRLPLFLPARVALRAACSPGTAHGRFELIDPAAPGRPHATGEFVGG